MFKAIRIAFPLAALLIACGDGPPSAPASVAVASARPSYDVGGESAAQAIQAIQDALNAAWAAKDAAAYAAPLADDANVITPVGTVLVGRAAFEARHVFLFAGPLKFSTQIVTFQRIQMLTGTIAIVDGNAVLTNGGVVTHSLARWIVQKIAGSWQIVAAQSTTVP